MIVFLLHSWFLLCRLSNFVIFRTGKLEAKVINAVNWVGRQLIYFRKDVELEYVKATREVAIYF